MSTLKVLFTVVIVLAFVSTSTQYDSVLSPICFHHECPMSTTNCKEHRKSSPDRSRIQVKVSCLDDYDASVKDFYYEEPSSIDPHTAYENTKYESAVIPTWNY